MNDFTTRDGFEKSLKELNVKIINEEEIIKIKPSVGEGSFGKVFKGKYGEKQIAIKKLLIDYDCENSLEDILTEIKSLIYIDTDNIPKFHGIWKKKHKLHLIFDFIDGKSLRDVYEEIDKKTKLMIIRDLCEIIKFLHSKKMIHRDIKPDNVMILSNYKPILVDFGTAKIARHTTTYTQSQKGTTLYMAPEAFNIDIECESEKPVPVGTYTDIWAIGCLISEIFSGLLPWQLNKSKKVNQYLVQQKLGNGEKFPIPSNLDNDIKEIVLRATDLTHINRPTAEELKVLIEKVIINMNI